MADNLINQGLERFAMGDLAGATRVWLAARAIFPDDPQLAAYLEHVQQVSPALYAHIEAEALGRERGAEPPKAPPARAAGSTASSVVPQRLEGVPLSLGSPLVVPTSPRPAPTPTPPAATPIPLGPEAVDDAWGHAEGRIEVHTSGPGLSLVGAPAQTREPQPRAAVASEPQLPLPALLEKLREAMSLDNFTGALELADRVLAEAPDNVEAQHAIKRSHARLSTIYGSKLGPLDAIPQVRIPPGEVIWLDLDHRAGFVLAQVDGQSSYEEIIDLTGMGRLEALRILANLVQKKIIAPRGA